LAASDRVANPVEVDPTTTILATNATTTIRSPYGGPIYLRATNNTSPTGSVTFIVGAGAKQIPVLVLGCNTFAQWLTQLNATDVTPYAEVIAKRTIITFNTESVKEALARDGSADMTLIAGLFDEMLASDDFVSGLDDSNVFNLKQQQLAHYTPH
jgi:hypothetical protein